MADVIIPIHIVNNQQALLGTLTQGLPTQGCLHGEQVEHSRLIICITCTHLLQNVAARLLMGTKKKNHLPCTGLSSLVTNCSSPIPPIPPLSMTWRGTHEKLKVTNHSQLVLTITWWYPMLLLMYLYPLIYVCFCIWSFLCEFNCVNLTWRFKYPMNHVMHESCIQLVNLSQHLQALCTSHIAVENAWREMAWTSNGSWHRWVLSTTQYFHIMVGLQNSSNIGTLSQMLWYVDHAA